MTERINGQGFRPTDTAGPRRTDGAKRTGGQTSETSRPGTSSTGETVSLTRSALLLRKLEEVVHSLPAVDADRVRAIKDAISAGTYEVDNQAVADNMIRMDR